MRIVRLDVLLPGMQITYVLKIKCVEQVGHVVPSPVRQLFSHNIIVSLLLKIMLWND